MSLLLQQLSGLWGEPQGGEMDHMIHDDSQY